MTSTKKVINFETLDFQSITNSLAEQRGVTRKQVISILNGTASGTDITNYEQYQSILKLRHDAIHWLICEFREVPFGEKPLSEFPLRDEVKSHKYYHLIKKQTPDMIQIIGNSVKISELTVSRIKQADIPKVTKYRLFVDVLKSCGYDVDLEVIVVNSAFSTPDREFLMNEYKFSDELVDNIYQVIENTDRVMYEVNETKLGAEWMAKSRGLMLETVDFDIHDDDIRQLHNDSQAKTFIDEDDLTSILESEEPSEITQGDDEFINSLVDQALNIISPLEQTQPYHQPIKDLIKYHEDNKSGVIDEDTRSFMPLPYIKQRFIDSSLRSTWGDIDEVTALKGSLVEAEDPFLVKLSQLVGTCGEIKLGKELEGQIALEGPNRRKFCKAGSLPHLKEASRWDKHWIPLYQSFNDHINDVSRSLSQIDKPVSDDVLKLTGPGLEYIKICQSIFREVNINSLRKERRRNFILKPTGVMGLFVVLYPGPKLRTGENLSMIWFKILMMKDFFTYDQLCSSWVFKSLKMDKNVYQSKWLSTDAHRLDHYIRCYDKILMAFACYESLSKNLMFDSMIRNTSNTLGIIIMIFMEDKRSTSKMLQDVRYLVMSCLSMFNYYASIMEKFKEPIRTPLQSYLLSKIIDFVKNPLVRTSVLASEFGRLNVEAGTGDSYDKYSGADINLPRILTEGPNITFKQVLCEMYFTMLFNKNQDDPTHASFQILSKILEGDKSLEWVKQHTQLHMGFKTNDMSDLKTLISNPHKNQFSRRAIIISSKLQSVSPYNKANGGVAHRMASQSIYINKYIDEFATFKSSSIVKNLKYNPKEYQKFDEKSQKNPELRMKVSEEKGVQNPRRRCLEGVKELIDEGCMRSFDLIKKGYLTEPLYYQVFKKNQIGGVREILILDIRKRILVNILESFSKVICTSDDREMLTHGDKKFTLMRDMIRELKRGEGKKLIMNYNFDKTKWAPSFMPIQFLYMFVPFRKLYPSLFRFIVISLIIHSNKKFLLPEKLIRVWRNDPHNDLQHLMDDNLQKLKEKFLISKDLTYLNESNMGQGILHYTSSYFHLCFISLRDEVFKRLCKRVGIETGQWRDIVSSDDSYTAHAIRMDSKNKARLRISLFLKAQEVTERVMNVWTSSSKSSISLLIYEFNSLFGSNLTMFPTTIKFALASVHPVNTDSFFRMVKESYIACRQIVENGGSLELYLLASRLNQIYCESIYHTNINGFNDPATVGLRREYTPYQLGVYPIDDPALMVMFGPEVHNYKIINMIDSISESERKVFLSMHTLVESSDPELFSAMGSFDDVMVGVNRIEAHMGPIRRLETIKKSLDMSWDDMKREITNDPMLLFNNPANIHQLKIKVYLKLFRFGASEALRTTAASIYYGRVSASVSAEAFRIPFVSTENETYQSCLKKLLNLNPKSIDLKVLYPHHEEFKIIQNLSDLEFDYVTRNIMETQNIRLLQLNKLQQRINNPIVNILNHYWGRSPVENPPTSYQRDWINLQELVPIIQPSLDQTLDKFNGDRDVQVRTLLLIILRLMSHSSKPMKTILFGPSAKSFDNAYLVLKQQNMYTNLTSSETRGIYLSHQVVKATDKLSFAFNYFALSVICKDENKEIINMDHLLKDSDIESFLMDNSLNTSSYKKILMLLLYHGRIDDITAWSQKTHTIFVKWTQRSGERGNYTGDYVFRTQLSSIVLQVSFNARKKQIKLTTNKVVNLTVLKELIEKSIEISGLNQQDFFRMVEPGTYTLTTDTVVALQKASGFKLYTATLQSIKYTTESIKYEEGYFKLYDREGTLIMQAIEGLLHSDYNPGEGDIKQDVFIKGISLRKLIKLRPFNTHFAIEHLNPRDIVDLLNSGDSPSESDLFVPKPHVTHITNHRLGTSYPVRGFEVEFADIQAESKADDDAETELIDPEQFYSSLLSQADSFMDDLSKLDLGNFHDDWIDTQIDLNLFKTMTRQILTYQPKKILETIINIKYQIITALVTNINMLNRKVIELIQSVFKNKFITYSLIYTYDRQYSNTEIKSPDDCEIKLDPTFRKRYIKEDYIDLDV